MHDGFVVRRTRFESAVGHHPEVQVLKYVLVLTIHLFPSSSAVEQLTVNQLVVGSIPAWGAILEVKMKTNNSERAAIVMIVLFILTCSLVVSLPLVWLILHN